MPESPSPMVHTVHSKAFQAFQLAEMWLYVREWINSIGFMGCRGQRLHQGSCCFAGRLGVLTRIPSADAPRLLSGRLHLHGSSAQAASFCAVLPLLLLTLHGLTSRQQSATAATTSTTTTLLPHFATTVLPISTTTKRNNDNNIKHQQC